MKKLIKFPTYVARKIKRVIKNLNSVEYEENKIEKVDSEIALYFYGGLKNIYQIEQWIKTLYVLNKEKKLILIVRNKAVYHWLLDNTVFTVQYVKTINELIMFYEINNIKCIIYVNNGIKNFQSLINPRALHVHINHGESDKTSTISNQAKAYDYIFIVGDAAYDKYELNLIKKDMRKFIKVGRPQLDSIETIDLPYLKEKKRRGKKIILYAPTWEGTHDSMNYTSIDEFGIYIVNVLLNSKDYYLIYKPHPNTGSRESSVKSINMEIINLINRDKNGEVILDGDINSLFKYTDLAIFDNSAVAIDYLQVNKPMIMMDMFYRIKDRISKATITKAARLISNHNINNILSIILEEITHDTFYIERNKVKNYFLGNFDYTKKESTKEFIVNISKICDERDKLLEEILKRNNEVANNDI